jgi:hypothetical protein
MRLLIIESLSAAVRQHVQSARQGAFSYHSSSLFSKQGVRQVKPILRRTITVFYYRLFVVCYVTACLTKKISTAIKIAVAMSAPIMT